MINKSDIRPTQDLRPGRPIIDDVVELGFGLVGAGAAYFTLDHFRTKYNDATTRLDEAKIIQDQGNQAEPAFLSDRQAEHRKTIEEVAEKVPFPLSSEAVFLGEMTGLVGGLALGIVVVKASHNRRDNHKAKPTNSHLPAKSKVSKKKDSKPELKFGDYSKYILAGAATGLATFNALEHFNTVSVNNTVAKIPAYKIAESRLLIIELDMIRAQAKQRSTQDKTTLKGWYSDEMAAQEAIMADIRSDIPPPLSGAELFCFSTTVALTAAVITAYISRKRRLNRVAV